MLTCTPLSLFSSTFRISGLQVGDGEIAMGAFTEEGTLVLDSTSYLIKKHGPFSGRWTLEDKGDICAEAHKPSAFSRHFKIQVDGTGFELNANSPFVRQFNFLINNRIVGYIQPEHSFTRRSIIQCDAKISERGQVFAFWLAALMWRRTARSSSS